MKRWSIWLICGLVAVLMMAGLYAIAVEYGSKDDPLVTLSYIDQVVLPETREDIDRQITQTLDEFDRTLDDEQQEIRAYVDQQLRTYASGEVDAQLAEQIAQSVADSLRGEISAPAGAVQWSIIHLEAGKTVTCGVGCQVILRGGSAVCVAPGSPGLVDVSDAETLENGESMEANHMYTVTDQGRELRITQNCTLLISGDYTVQ